MADGVLASLAWVTISMRAAVFAAGVGAAVSGVAFTLLAYPTHDATTRWIPGAYGAALGLSAALTRVLPGREMHTSHRVGVVAVATLLWAAFIDVQAAYVTALLREEGGKQALTVAVSQVSALSVAGVLKNFGVLASVHGALTAASRRSRLRQACLALAVVLVYWLFRDTLPAPGLPVSAPSEWLPFPVVRLRGWLVTEDERLIHGVFVHAAAVAVILPACPGWPESADSVQATCDGTGQRPAL